MTWRERNKTEDRDFAYVVRTHTQVVRIIPCDVDIDIARTLPTSLVLAPHFLYLEKWTSFIRVTFKIKDQEFH